MKITVHFLPCFIFLFSCHQNIIYNQNPDIKKIFVDWNKSTMNSLDSQISLSETIQQTNYYKNRIVAFKSFNEIQHLDKVNTESIRYKFLQTIINENEENDTFYVVESIRSGEQVEIDNYVVYPTSTKVFKVKLFHFKNGEWIKNKNSFEVYLNIESNLKKNFTKFGIGFNQDDVVISKFEKYILINSEFYLFTTLAESTNVKNLFLLK